MKDGRQKSKQSKDAKFILYANWHNDIVIVNIFK